MTPDVLLVGTGGAIGAVLRYLVILSVDGDRFPTETFTVNVLGSFVLGIVTFAGLGSGVGLAVGVGACGAFTTFSSFSVDTVRLVDGDEPVLAGVYAGGTLLAALAAVGLAWVLVQAGLAA